MSYFTIIKFKSWIRLLAVLVISLSCQKLDNSGKFNIELKKIESQLYESHDSSITSLDGIRDSLTTKYQKAYFNLLYAIASDAALVQFNKDSDLITSSIQFAKNNDTYNYARALLYIGISRYNRNKQDTSVYNYLKEAEKLFDENNFDDNTFKGRMYLSLGLINKINRNFTEAEKYFLKALAISHKERKIIIEQNIRIELFWTYLAERQNSKALNSIIAFEDVLPASPKIKYRLYEALSGYYSSKKEYSMSIEYLKKMLLIIENDHIIEDASKMYYSLAMYYRRMEELDSALEYGTKAVNAITDSTSLDSHFAYKHLADIYSEKGDYMKALQNFRSAHRLYVNNYSKLQRDKIIEIERKYDTVIIKTQLQANVKAKCMLSRCLSIVLGILILSSYYFIMKHIKLKKQAILDRSIQNFNLLELKKLKLVNEILQISNDIVPIADHIYNLAHKSKTNSNDVFKTLIEYQDTTKEISKSKISEVANNEMFNSEKVLKKYNDLSDLEKIIILLIEYEYPIKEIAKILNTTVPRINAIKHKASFKRLK